MECYGEPTMIKTYRGILADGGQDKINLKTNRGDIGYKIVKFQVIQQNPGAAHAEAVVKIYKVKQTSIDAVINFSDGDLLAAIAYQKSDSVSYAGSEIIIFDNQIVNQDIYVTLDHASGHTEPMNYYLELEQISLNDNESTMATLQSLRQIAQK